MRKDKKMIAAAAAVVLGLGMATTGAMAQKPGGMMGGHAGGNAHMGAGSGAGMHTNAGTSMRMNGPMAQGNVQSNVKPNTMGQNRTYNGHNYAYRNHDHDGHGHPGVFAFGGPVYYDYYDDYYDNDDCYQPRRVATPYGWRWQRVWVCD